MDDRIPPPINEHLARRGFSELRPAQRKSIEAGLFAGRNLLVCTPTASGKTLVGELAALHAVQNGGKAVYVVPLRALASEKHKAFAKEHPSLRIALTSGDVDKEDSYLAAYDIIITTSEKLDSLIRHRTPWLPSVHALILDEIHLLNDPSRGPTLEVLITLMRSLLPKLQVIGLSATIGNPEEVAAWLDAALVVDTWRPVRLDRGIHLDGTVTFFEKEEKRKRG